MVAAALGALLLYAPFVAAAGPGRMYDALIGTAAGDGAYWRLPFPLDYDGRLRLWPPGDLARDGKDVLGFYLPLIGLAGAALAATAIVAAWRGRRGGAAVVGAGPRRGGGAIAGTAVLSLGCLAYLLTRPDELHAQPLLTCLAALIPLGVAARGDRAARARGDRAAGPRGGRAAEVRSRLLQGAAAVVVGLFVLAGAANRLSALLLPPDLRAVHLRGVPGIGVPPSEAAALPRLAARVDALVPPGQPIYVAPRRSDLVTLTDPLVHFVVQRPNVLHRDVLLQAKPLEQARILAALQRARPKAIVRWTDPASDRPEPNARGRPSGSRALDDYLVTAYRLDARYGAYDVLVPRRP